VSSSPVPHFPASLRQDEACAAAQWRRLWNIEQRQHQTNSDLRPRVSLVKARMLHRRRLIDRSIPFMLCSAKRSAPSPHCPGSARMAAGTPVVVCAALLNGQHLGRCFRNRWAPKGRHTFSRLRFTSECGADGPRMCAAASNVSKVDQVRSRGPARDEPRRELAACGIWRQRWGQELETRGHS
jgi:hypothetical protein